MDYTRLLFALTCLLLAGCVTPSGIASVAPVTPVGLPREPAQDGESAAVITPETESGTPAIFRADGLQEYRARSEVRIETIADEPVLQAWTITEMQVSRDADEKRVAMTIMDRALSEAGEQSDIVMTDSAVYFRKAGAPRWTRLAASPDALVLPGLLDPEQLAEDSAPALSSAAVVGIEEIEGVQTTHYQIIGQALVPVLADALPPGGKLIEGQMDIWVSTGGTLKQALQEYIVEDAGGTQTRHSLTMLILEENLPHDLALPADEEVDELLVPEPPTPEAAGATPTATSQ